MTAGRLHRKLRPASGVFTLRMGDRDLTDNDLISVTITRGDDSPWPALAPSVVEFETSGGWWAKPNQSVTARLNWQYARDVLGDSSLAFRASGRMGTWTTADQGGSHQISTIQSVHWSSLLERASRKVKPINDDQITDVLVRVLRHPDLDKTYYTAFHDGETSDWIGVDEPWTKGSELLRKYAGTATGITIRERRTGDLDVVALPHRDYELRAARDKSLPILRREGIAPATWEQTVGAVKKQFTMTRRTSENNVPYTHTWPVPTGITHTLTDQVEIDWSNIRDRTGSYEIFLRALTAQENMPANEMRTLKLDMIHLLTSEQPYDQRIARQVLGMEIGDLVMLGADWPIPVRGSYCANRIIERITSETWEVELALHSTRQVVGWSYDENQIVPAYTWDQMNGTWDAASGTWDAAAPPN